ncbi:proline-rich receptor-like protein kinase PERK10 [Siniperca chuatsi]|uniref:proline-rich receptor-like protein kinase PERK10 n=1 Tax=Siniperca chuatsi TaxID=119488 RepID=UPI001CE0E3D7|nr:proline-rich receptor-like protein kinase PERK10 [Siniperca chuatsi]
MSVFDRLAPLIPQVAASSKQTTEHPSVCLSPPLSLSSPVIKKKPIQIPSFDEKGFIYENTKQTNTDRSFVPVSQRNHGERASTLPRTKPKTYSSPTLSAKPSISIFPAPKPNSSPTLSTLKPKPSASLHLPASQLSDPSPLLHQPQPKPSVSPTLTVPTPRLSPSPTSLCRGMSLDSGGGKQPSPVAKERRARSITISNTKVESSKQRPSNEAKHDILDQEALLDFTHPALRRACPMTCREMQSRHQTYSESQRQVATSLNSCLSQGKVGLSKKENTAKDKPKPPPRNIDITAIPQLKPNIKQQQEFLPSGATGTQTSLSESKGIQFANVVQREAQSAFDGLATHRKCIDYPQSRKYTQTAEPLLNQSTVSPNIETRRRRFGFNNETKILVKGQESNHPDGREEWSKSVRLCFKGSQLPVKRHRSENGGSSVCTKNKST